MKTWKCSSMLRCALLYGEHGFPIFPCSPHGKEPLTPHGFKDATTDPAQIRRWWKQWTDANIGISTGKASGLLVLDVDPRNGGFESSEALAPHHRKKPKTAIQIAGGDGLHSFFKDLLISYLRAARNRVGDGSRIGFHQNAR